MAGRSPAKIAQEIIIPANIAMPPNLGIGLLCTLLLSFGISIAPIFGANQMAKGVRNAEINPATTKGAHKSKLVAVKLFS